MEKLTSSTIGAFLGTICGLPVGAIAGLVLSPSICSFFGATSFEGANGYFTLLIVVPVCSLIGVFAGGALGILTGAQIARVRKQRVQRQSVRVEEKFLREKE